MNNIGKINISEIVITSIAEALMISKDQIATSTCLVSDLEAESIDIVDIRFRIEQAIGMKIDQKTMIDNIGNNLTAEEFNSLFTVQFIIDYIQKICDENYK